MWGPRVQIKNDARSEIVVPLGPHSQRRDSVSWSITTRVGPLGIRAQRQALCGVFKGRRGSFKARSNPHRPVVVRPGGHEPSMGGRQRGKDKAIPWIGQPARRIAQQDGWGGV